MSTSPSRRSLRAYHRSVTNLVTKMQKRAASATDAPTDTRSNRERTRALRDARDPQKVFDRARELGIPVKSGS